MKMVVILNVLWRRHRWEVLLFVSISLLLSGLLWKSTGAEFYRSLSWLEVASLVWLVTRVALTQPGFGTFGGWKARPDGRAIYWFGELLFLTIPLLIALIPRLVVVAELLQPFKSDWPALIEGWGWSIFKIALLYTICKVLGLTWEQYDARSRPRLAWGVILTLIVGSLTMSNHWGQMRRSGGNYGNFEIDPRDLPEVDDWQWLRSGQEASGKAADLNPLKVPLREGAASSDTGFRMKLIGVELTGETIVVRIEVTATDLMGGELPRQVGLTLAFENGYYGGVAQSTFETRLTQVPFFELNQAIYTARMFTPLSLPENQLSPDELLKGAELWVNVGLPLFSLEKPRREIKKEEATDRELLRWWLASLGRDSPQKIGALRVDLMAGGEEVMNEVLAAAPWSEVGASEIVLPYLVKFATEADKPRLLEMLKRDPFLADVFLEKGWEENATPILREHLEKGKTLTKRTVIFLASLDEKEMGPPLENQLLRMSGDLDEVIAAVREHPGVDWDRVRRAAWDRMATGFGRHGQWAKWGAELGEQEALQILLIEANSGKEWDRAVLESWFGKEGDVVTRLRENWEKVTFEDGRWRLDIASR